MRMCRKVIRKAAARMPPETRQSHCPNQCQDQKKQSFDTLVKECLQQAKSSVDNGQNFAAQVTFNVMIHKEDSSGSDARMPGPWQSGGLPHVTWQENQGQRQVQDSLCDMPGPWQSEHPQQTLRQGNQGQLQIQGRQYNPIVTVLAPPRPSQRALTW